MAINPVKFAKDFLQLKKPSAKKYWVSEFKSMARHTQEKDLDELIKERRPNEPEDIQKYRKKNMRAITTEAITRATNNLQRIFSQTKAIVKINDEDVKAFVRKPIFESFNLNTYINQEVLPRMIEDANGWLIWWPSGEGVEMPTTKVTPQPILVLSENIMLYNSNVIAFKSDETVDLSKDKDGQQLLGDVYYIIDETGFWKYKQEAIGPQNKWVLEKWYDQDFDELPVIILGGENKCKTEGTKSIKYKTSFFAGYIPFADESIAQFSDHQGVMVTASFPIKVIEGTDCTTCDGKGFTKDSEGKYTCETCVGTGTRAPTSPYGLFVKQPVKSGPLETEKPTMNEPVSFVSPDVEIIKYGGEYWQQLLALGEKSLDLNYIDEAQSGVAKEIDREQLMARLDRIGVNVYMNIYLNSILQINALLSRGKGEDTVVEIVLPNTFRTKTEKELVGELTSLIEKGAPYPIIASTMMEYAKKKWEGDQTMIKIIEFMLLYDPYFIYPPTKRAELVSTGAISNTDARRSLLAYSEASRLADEKGPKFLEMKLTDIEKEINKRLAPKLVQLGGAN